MEISLGEEERPAIINLSTSTGELPSPLSLLFDITIND